MIPKVSRCGRSFKGIFSYCLSHRKGNERVAWTKALNLPDLGKETWRLMVHTVQTAEVLKRENGASRSGRKLERPVFAYSLSWAPGQDPDQQHMEEVALRSLKALGLEEHEVWLVSHNDTDHPHLHVIANRVHPLTGYAASVDRAVHKLQKFASDYERETKLYCLAREEKRHQVERKSPPRLDELQSLWDTGLSGEAFLLAIQQMGFRLMQGRKRPVFVSLCDQVFNPTRVLKGVTARQVRERLKNITLPNLPDEPGLFHPHQRVAPKTICSAPSEWLS